MRAWRLPIWSIHITASLVSVTAIAQSTSSVQTIKRSYDGWRPAAPTPQVRFFQSPGSGENGLPALPSFTQGTGSVAPTAPSPADLPPTLPPLSLPQTPSAGRLADSPAPNDRTYDPGTSPHNVSTPSPVLPQTPPNKLRFDPASRATNSAGDASRHSLAQRRTPVATAQLSTRQDNVHPASTRPVGTTARPGAGQGGAPTASVLPPAASPRHDPSTIATGLPYVTPAPGRYPTSPYNPTLFHTVAYQVPGSGAQGAAASLPPVTSSLPQYVQPGIYPTSYQCTSGLAPSPTVPTTGAVGGTFIPPTLTPNWNPNLYSPTNAGFRPLITLGQENYNVVLGRGIIGQPTVYVPGQHIRNFLRYLSP
ncbi:MAG: hypothetical protein KatS3mg111_1760 [Pirellulaceae bacterium]|nr:MAG: hypothetical protein KatS3mg111_1760 [Pirellulaceae bacterium]